ncbi:MAG TPA: signal peptidase II [Vicinamibacteria bacterium]
MEGFGRRALVLAAGISAILAFDQATKILAASRLLPGESVPIIPGLLHFTLVRNTGMAFGILSAHDFPFKSVIMTLLSLAALGAVVYYALRSPRGESLTRWGLTLILGGALGNILDRARLGYVIDFVDVFYRDAHWPAFNVADSCICIGVGLWLLDSLWRPERRSVASPEPAVRSEPVERRTAARAKSEGGTARGSAGGGAPVH